MRNRENEQNQRCLNPQPVTCFQRDNGCRRRWDNFVILRLVMRNRENEQNVHKFNKNGYPVYKLLHY